MASTNLIDGRAIAEQIHKETAQRIAAFHENTALSLDWLLFESEKIPLPGSMLG